MLEHDGADAAALETVGDVERDLGARRVAPSEAVVAADADDVVANGRDEGDTFDVVDVREAAHVTIAQALDRGEEAQVDRFLALRGVEAVDAFGVVGADGAHVGHRTVAQDDVGLPLAWVVGRDAGLHIAHVVIQSPCADSVA